MYRYVWWSCRRFSFVSEGLYNGDGEVPGWFWGHPGPVFCSPGTSSLLSRDQYFVIRGPVFWHPGPVLCSPGTSILSSGDQYFALRGPVFCHPGPVIGHLELLWSYQLTGDRFFFPVSLTFTLTSVLQRRNSRSAFLTLFDRYLLPNAYKAA